MLEQFHVPEDIAIRVPQENMRSTVEDIFRKMQMPEEDAVQAADVLMYADIRGVESHGVSNMMRAYVAGFQQGRINPNPDWKIVRQAAAVCTIDSDKGHGLVIGPAAMNIAIERAEKYGIGSVSVTNGAHFGAAGYHAIMALEHDMIGIAMTTGGVSVLPTQGSERMVGLNPIAIAAPGRNEPPFIFDASMSSVAGNKIVLAKRLGVDALPAWVAGADGAPIMDAQPVPDDFKILPLGGTREIGSHKGYSLAVMIEILSGVLSGGAAGPLRRGGASHHFIAYKIDAFVDVDLFKDDMDAYMAALRESAPAPGEDRVVYAGLPEHEEEIERLEHGIPYHPEVIEWFQSITAELELPDRFS
ncbi:MAG: Ldh family oxidoreductase [SAR202 cluster bacterium]|nr:Ldh family oxidoreductase [SAR202 cluster bacterium]MDP6798350.1 Ldh family oxidoreductase [SAR202 cluster bacterium]